MYYVWGNSQPKSFFLIFILFSPSETPKLCMLDLRILFLVLLLFLLHFNPLSHCIISGKYSVVYFPALCLIAYNVLFNTFTEFKDSAILFFTSKISI